MPVTIGSPISLNADYPNVDDRYTIDGNPYASVAEAAVTLGSKINEYYIGLTVLVKESSWPKAKEYWVQPYDNNGVTAYHLEEKLGSQAEQKQSDWNQDDENEKDFIKNKPTKLSQFTNDAGYAELNQVAAALANKVDKINDKQLSTEDFTTALKQKLESMPTISVNGDVLIINGKEYKLSPVPVVADYYIGFTNGSKSEFAALSASQLTALAEGYMISSKPQYEHAYGDNQIFFLMYQANKAPKTVNLISSGQTMAQDLESDNTCPHDPVTIDGTTYKIFGIRLSSTHDASDVMSLTF